MKTILRLKQCVLVLVAALAMTSCLKSEEEEFGFYSYGVAVYQTTKLVNADLENPVYSTTYIPYIQIAANEAISSYSCKGPNGIIEMELVNSYYTYLQTAIISINSSSKYPVGSYTVQAINSSQEVAQHTLSITESKPLGYINVKNLDFNSTTKEITAQWDEVENASAYSVSIGEEGKAFSELASKIIEKKNYKPEDGVKITLSSTEATNLQQGKSYTLYIRAIRREASNETLLISDSEKSKTITW